MSRRLLYILFLLTCLASCKQDIVSSDPNLRLQFSQDSVLFDTVFTSMGSSTRRVMVYNPNEYALTIRQVTLQDNQYFRINLDGESELSNLRNITLSGKDSLFLFIRVHVDPQASNTPVLVEDNILFSVNGHQQSIHLQAYGQNVCVMRDSTKRIIREQCTFTSTMPYVIYDTLIVAGDLHIEAGATLYMHTGAGIYVYGNLDAVGTQSNPITIRGDRTDRLFDSVPYSVASGQWNGIYLLSDAEQHASSYTLDYVNILSGSIGLYVASESSERPTLHFSNGRIHNHSKYGLVLINTDAVVANSEISNCASYCVYLAGGTHQFIHNTIASFFGYPYTNLNIHSNIVREDMAAVYINNLDKEVAATQTSFYNCIVTGARKNNIVVATPLPNRYDGRFVGNYLQADTLSPAYAWDNVYPTDSDSVMFRNVYYRYKEYHYYDFRLDSLSPARHIADPTFTVSYPADRLGHMRDTEHPDAGCYEYTE